MSLTFNGRLPGVVCQAALPPRAEAPLRLDVAGFVGFAERGPCDRPVALEDISQYRAVFGGDLPVAREGGRPVYAALPGAVRAFFDNGGRRCYVVRVTGDGAWATRFRLPGLVSWRGGEEFATPIATAASVGRWSERLSVGTQLSRWPLRALDYRPAARELDLEVPAATTVRPGDLLRLRLAGADGETVVFFPAASVQTRGPAATTVRGLPITVRAAEGTVLAFATAADPGSPPALPVVAARLGEAGWELDPLPVPLGFEPVPAKAGGGFALLLPDTERARPGDLLRVTFSGGQVLLFPVAAAGPAGDAGSPPAAATLRLLAREALWAAPAPVASPPDGPLIPLAADLLRFDLFIREGEETLEAWPGLRFGPGPGYWADALAPPTAAAAEAAPDGDAPGGDPARSRRLRAPDEVALPAPPLFLPLGMSELPGPDQFAGPLPAAGSAPGKDGLDSFDPVALFLDPQLAGFGARTVLGEANRLLYLGDAPGRLYKLHSLLPLDEVGLIAAPDLAHRQWGPPEPLPEEYEPPPPPPAPPDWSRFQDCQPPAPPEPLSPPLPEHAPCPTPFGFASPPASEPAPGEGSDARRWLTALPVLEPVAAYAVGPLLQVQRALIDLCAARADALAVLSLPGHFARRETLEWATALATTPEYATGSPPSYAAVYHPWLLEREEATPELAPLRAVPPDGAACGLIAARELSRGPWIAPANVPLRGVVGLAPALTASDEAALFDARVNLLGRQPGRFTPLSAHTLSQDHLLLQVSVRRLLIFLRKLALRRGMRYVFESNNERFRQRVQGSFEQTLRLLTARGALAAFEVVTDDGLNTPNDRDNGRFLIALKVAPTMPIEFITVVLLRAGEGLLDVLER